MAALTTSEILETIRALGLVEGAALREMETLSGDPREILDALVQRQRITAYQADELLAGRGAQLVLGPYLIVEPIGKGGMGQVFRARQHVLERDCALKIIRKDRLQTEESIERFRREARAAAKLKHPNIVAVYDANVADGVHYLAMELLQGVTLHELVKKNGQLSVGRACRYVQQAAIGLQHAHEQGLVHRDIKPQNLFLEDGSDQVKILDLGLARVREIPQHGETETGELTREGEVMGTPDYMAPEQALDTRSADHRADIYSLGCTLYYLLTGRPPFPGGSLTEKLLAHQQREPIPLDQLCSGVPEKLASAIKKAMAKHPSDRYQTPREFADELAPFEHAEQILAVAPMPAPPRETMQASSLQTLPPIGPVPRRMSGWMLVVLILGIVACCPVSLAGFVALLASVVLTGEGKRAEQGGIVEEFGPVPRVDQQAPPAKLKAEVTELRVLDGRNFFLSPDGSRIMIDKTDPDFDFEVREFDSGKRLFNLPKGDEGLGFTSGDPPRVFVGRNRVSIALLNDNLGEVNRSINFLGGQAFKEFHIVDSGKTAVINVDKSLVAFDLEQMKQKHEVALPDFPRHFSVDVNGAFALVECAKRLRLWSLSNDVAEREYFGHVNPIVTTAISPDGAWIAAGHGNGGVTVWSRDNPKKGRSLVPLGSSVSCLAFSTNGQRLLAGGSGASLSYFDVAKGVVISGCNTPSGITNAVIHPDGKRAITASKDKKIRIWTLPQ